MLVVETFSGDNLKFNMYALIGWGKYKYTGIYVSEIERKAKKARTFRYDYTHFIFIAWNWNDD